MAGFDRFNKTWAISGLASPASDAQADAGFAFLGAAPPTVELFNGMFQDLDQKDNYLFGQIERAIALEGITLDQNDLTQLHQAMRSAAGAVAGAYVLKAGDSMTGSLNIQGTGLGVIYSAPTTLLFGPWGNNNVAFGWDGSNAVRVRIDDFDVGLLRMNIDPGAFVLKAGDTMTGALYTPTLLPCFPAAASCQISANVDNIFFTMDPGFFWSYARGGASGGTLSWISGAGSIGLGQNGILSTTGNVFIGGGTVNITSATARVALGTDMTASLVCEGGSTALICDGRPGFYSQFSYSSITQRFGFVSPSFPGGGGPTAWEMDWSGNTHQQGNANIAGQFIGTITDPYAGIAIATTEAVKGVAGPWIGGSDARIKQNIVPYSRGLAAVLQLNPVEYSFIPETGLDSTRRHVGIIGQDVQPIMPEMITASSTKIGSLMFNDLLIYNPNALLYALVNAVQELATLVQELKGSATAHA